MAVKGEGARGEEAIGEEEREEEMTEAEVREEEVSEEEVMEEEEHVMTMLLARAPWDQGVETFLVRMFLHLPRYLKACRRVSTAWDSFILRHLWGRPAVRSRLTACLARNWRLGVPIRQFELTLPAISCLACDDEVLVLGGRGEVLVYSLLPLRQLTTLHLGQESGQEEEVKLAVAKDFIVTVQTTTRKMQVWSKTCSLLDSVDIWDLVVRVVSAKGSTVVLAGTSGGGWMYGNRGVILVYGMEERLKHLYTVTLAQELGTCRAVAWEEGGQELLSGHDNHVVVWERETGKEVRRIQTGLVVDMVVSRGILVTAGSLQSLGVRLWCATSGLLLATHGASSYFEALHLAGGQLFARGLQCDRIVLPSLSSLSLDSEVESERWLAFSPLMAANTTKLVVVQTVPAEEGEAGGGARRTRVAVKDFWSKT